MTEARTLEASLRPLDAAERRRLASRARSLRTTAGRGSQVVLLAIGTVIALWILTLLVSDADPLFITAFWVVAGAVIALWVHHDFRRDARYLRAMADDHEFALERDEAEVYEIRARAFAELEEVEDEGACYAFELEGDRVVFVVGQEFYPGPRFPSLDFSLVYPLGRTGPVDLWIEDRGPKAAPARVVPAATEWRSGVPLHLTVIPGTLDGLDRWLEERESDPP